MEQPYLADSNTLIDCIGNKMPGSSLLILDSYFNDIFKKKLKILIEDDPKLKFKMKL